MAASRGKLSPSTPLRLRYSSGIPATGTLEDLVSPVHAATTITRLFNSLITAGGIRDELTRDDGIANRESLRGIPVLSFILRRFA